MRPFPSFTKLTPTTLSFARPENLYEFRFMRLLGSEERTILPDLSGESKHREDRRAKERSEHAHNRYSASKNASKGAPVHATSTTDSQTSTPHSSTPTVQRRTEAGILMEESTSGSVNPTRNVKVVSLVTSTEGWTICIYWDRILATKRQASCWEVDNS